MQNPIITGILSYGMSGRLFHAPFVSIKNGFVLRAVTERSKKNAAIRYPDVISYNTVEELLQDDAIELVIVNTPNNTHYELTKAALLAGKHVLVEKPFTSTVAEATELFDLARTQNRQIMVYQNRRWDADFLSVKEIIKSGKLGKLIEANFRFDRYKKELSPKYFKETSVPASGLTFDLGPHLLDQVISLFGKPLKSYKTTGSNRPESKVEDYMAFVLKYPNGLTVNVTANLLTAQPVPSFILHGTDGSFIKDRTDVQEAQLNMEISPFDRPYGVEKQGSEGQLTTFSPEGKKQTEYVRSLKGNYSRLFEAVYNQLRNSQPYPVKEEEIIWQLELLEKTAD